MFGLENLVVETRAAARSVSCFLASCPIIFSVENIGGEKALILKRSGQGQEGDLNSEEISMIAKRERWGLAKAT